AHRYKYGAPAERCNSNARIPKGAALAGFAWENPKKLFKREDIPLFGTAEEFTTFYRTEFKMRDDIVETLSEHMMQVRSIFCLGLVNHRDEVIGVLSIDSTEPKAFR